MTAVDTRADETVRELPPTGLAWWLSDAMLLAGRSVRHIRRRPDQLMAAVLQPIMFFLVFAYVFGGAIKVPGGDYKQFLLPGSFGQIVVFGSVASMCVGIAEDMRNGMMDRFRSLPMSRASILLGRALAEVLRNVIAVVVLGTVGLLLGFRFHGTVLESLAGVGILLLFGFALSWALAVIGLTASSAEGAQSISMPWLFLLGFVSSAYVPTDSMPGWMAAFAEHSPVSVTINAARDWFNGTDPAGQAWQSLLWSIGLLVVFVPLTASLVRRRTAAT